MKKITIGAMRQCTLPKEKDDESEDLKSIRKNCASTHPDKLRVAVSDSLADLVTSLTKAGAAADTKPQK